MIIDEPTEKLTNLTEQQRLRDMGKYYLQNDMVAQALLTYLTLLEKNPEDVAALVIIGDAYLMAGDVRSARTIYKNAIALDERRQDIRQRLELVENTGETQESIAGGFPPLHPQAVNRLAERLSGKSLSVDEDQVRRAAELLEKTVHSESPANSVSEHLEEIDALLPAILELNIRQARAQGRSDLAAELIELQRSLLADQKPVQKPGTVNLGIQTITESREKALQVVLIGEPSEYSPLRQSVIKAALQKAGFRVEDRWENLALPWDGFDLVLAHNPHANPVFMKALAGWAGSGNPVLVDMDMDFRQQPYSVPGNETKPRDTLYDPRIFTAALQLADIVTFPSTNLALRFAGEGYQAFTVPDGWQEHNSLWTKSTPPSNKLNIGIFSDSENLENAASIRRIVIRILREFPQTRLVVSGNPQVYQLFETIPDTRRIYLPPSEPEDYPYLLAQADIHLLPDFESEESQSASDRRYMEIGVRKAVWIGSPTPAAEGWTAGGLIARSLDDWYTHLKTLILDNDCRIRLSQQGFEKAGMREASNLASAWESVLKKALKNDRSKPFMKGQK